MEGCIEVCTAIVLLESKFAVEVETCRIFAISAGACWFCSDSSSQLMMYKSLYKSGVNLIHDPPFSKSPFLPRRAEMAAAQLSPWLQREQSSDSAAGTHKA